MTTDRVFDLTPSPRVLKMLGQVDFKPWQCLAELIDNSVDAFLSSASDGLGYMFPQVTVETPDNATIDLGTGAIRVFDNGPGMTSDSLEQAVRAGFSTNNPVDKLGLFGMGFNVATARLGQRTEVWTTRINDDTWSGVAIDFDEIERGGFAVPALSKPKTPAEKDRHGTEVIISKLDEGRAKYLRTGGGAAATRNKLSRIYNKIMREKGLVIVLGGQQLSSREFCVWGDNRYVETRGWAGRVPARLEIDTNLGNREYCDSCWIWLEEKESVCPSCESRDSLSIRGRQVTGWIGIQRYFDEEDFGIDLIRNGRIIEERSKEFFRWEGIDGEIIPEYPLEQLHWGGRIVGELDIGFVPLASHQKDSFDHSSREWTMVYEAVHGDGSILVETRKKMGYPSRSESPIARLHVGYRRGHPAGLRTLVPGDANAGKGFNVEAQQWATKFWDGDDNYQTDKAWWDAVVAAEEARSKSKSPKVPDDLVGADLLPDHQGVADADGSDTEVAVAEPDRATDDLDSSLSGDFTVDGIDACPTLNVETRRLTSGRLGSGQHMEFAAAGSRVVVSYDPAHPLFTESLVEPVDCLVEELAFQFLSRTNVVQADWGVSRIAQYLRDQYFSWSQATVQATEARAAALLEDTKRAVALAYAPDSDLKRQEIPTEIRDEASANYMRQSRQGADKVNDLIDSGDFVLFLGAKTLVDLIRINPRVICDGRFLDVAYDSADSANQISTAHDVCTALEDSAELASRTLDNLAVAERKAWLARGLGSLALLDTWRA
jgi:hypothetical protein